MTKRVQIIGHITADADDFVGRAREVTVDITANELRVHDGAVAGGHRILNLTQLQALFQPLGSSDFTSITTNIVNEHTGNAGVTVDGVLIKDGLVDGIDVSVLGVEVNTNIPADIAVVQADINTHEANVSNPHATTKTQVGLSNVTNDAQLKIASNLSDLNNVSTARTNLGLGSLATLSTVGAAQITDGSVGTLEIADAAVTYAKVQNISAASRLLGRGSAAGAGDVQELTISDGLLLSATVLRGSVLQTTYDESKTPGVLASEIIPSDDTSPLSTEGALGFSRAFTPKLATSKIHIHGALNVGCSTQSIDPIVTVYEGTTLLGSFPNDNVSNTNQLMPFYVVVDAVSTSARTYSVRYGSDVGTIALNIAGNGSDYGNSIVSNMIIEERVA